MLSSSNLTPVPSEGSACSILWELPIRWSVRCELFLGCSFTEAELSMFTHRPARHSPRSPPTHRHRSETNSETDRDRRTDTQKHADTSTQTCTRWQTHRHRHTETLRHADTQRPLERPTDGRQDRPTENRRSPAETGRCTKSNKQAHTHTHTPEPRKLYNPEHRGVLEGGLQQRAPEAQAPERSSGASELM